MSDQKKPDSKPSPVWLVIYDQANNYLREGGKKRDQLIAFYLLLLAAVIGAGDKLKDSYEIAVFAVWLIGLASYFVATLYWRWHIVLTLSLITIQRLMMHPSLTIKECEEAWNAVNDDQTVWQLMSPLRGIEGAMLYVLAIITLVPAHLFLKAIQFSIVTVSADWIAFLLNLVIYAPFLVFLSARYVKQFHSFRKNEWPFRWLRDTNKEERT